MAVKSERQVDLIEDSFLSPYNFQYDYNPEDFELLNQSD